MNVDCPHCSGSEGPHLGWNLSSGYFRCWRCGWKPLLKTLCALSRKLPQDVIPDLKKYQGGGAALGAERGGGPGYPIPPYRGEAEKPQGVGYPSLPHLKYLAGRGLDPPEVIRVWGVEGAGAAAGVSLSGAGSGGRGAWLDLSWRLFIPIRLNGVMVSWTSRHIGSHSLRYISCPKELEAVDHKTLLFGADLVPRDKVIVVEGPMDAIKIGPGAVATFGIVWKWEQVSLLGEYSKRFILFDNDVRSIDSQKRARALAHAVQSIFGGTTEVVTLEDYKDAGELPPEKVAMLRTELLGGV